MVYWQDFIFTGGALCFTGWDIANIKVLPLALVN